MIENDFLKAYSSYMGWKLTSPDNIMRMLCEDYYYAPDGRGKQFMMIALGWMWGKTGDYAKANCGSVMLEIKLGEMYKIVAKENNWSE